MIGPISLDMKSIGKRSALNAHAAFDEGGAGNVTMACWTEAASESEQKDHQQTYGARASALPNQSVNRREAVRSAPHALQDKTLIKKISSHPLTGGHTYQIWADISERLAY